MKKIYELVYRTENGYLRNLLFSRKKKAYYYLTKYYAEGMYIGTEEIVSSSVVERILF